jgi:proteasome lid subunit RPN8/RPN11
VIDDMRAHAQEAAPRECCGLLVGRADHVERSVRARNLADSASRFLIDPQDHIAAIRQARRHDDEVIGFYHSHPASKASPSTVDREEAVYTDLIHAIVGLESGERVVRVFKLSGAGFEELPYSVVPADAGARLNLHVD